MPDARRSPSSWRVQLLWAEFVLVVILQLVALSAAIARPAPVVPAGRAFPCTPTHVWDGDGPIWCREGPHLRLAGIATRELNGSCRRGHPCPAASGIAARDALVRLLGGAAGRSPDGHVLVHGARLTCMSGGADRYRRTLARCWLRGRNLGQLLVTTGVALPWQFTRKHLL